MDFEATLSQLGQNGFLIALAIIILLVLFKGVRIVPQSEKFVVERFGRLKSVMGPGLNFIVPFLDRVRHRVSVLERQLPTNSQDAITSDNVLVKVDTSVFYRITEPAKTVYRIRDVDAAISTTVAGIVRAEIGQMELDEVQSNRSELINAIKSAIEVAVDDWGVEVTRAELLDVNLDRATQDAMLQQLNADAELYSAEQAAKARRVQADAEAYATGVVARAIAKNGVEAAQYQVALKQVEALTALGGGEGKQTILVPSNAMDAFADAFKMLKGSK